MGSVPPSPLTVSVSEAEKQNVKVLVFLIEHVHQMFEQVATAAHVLMSASLEISRSTSGQLLTPVKDETERLMALYHVVSDDWAAKRYENQLKELNALSVTKAELTTRDWAIILTGTAIILSLFGDAHVRNRCATQDLSKGHGDRETKHTKSVLVQARD